MKDPRLGLLKLAFLYTDGFTLITNQTTLFLNTAVSQMSIMMFIYGPFTYSMDKALTLHSGMQILY